MLARSFPSAFEENCASRKGNKTKLAGGFWRLNAPFGVLLSACLLALVTTLTSPGAFAQSPEQANTAVPASTGTTHYVSPNGSNSNPGTSTAPWQTITYAASKVAPGDTVLVGAGTYHESVPIAISGTATAPITFNGQGGKAIVDGTGVACCAAPAFAADSWIGSGQGLFTLGAASGLNYVTLEGFTIQNYTTSDASVSPAGILIAGGGTGIVVTGNTVQHITSTASGSGDSGPQAYGIGVFGTSATPLSVTVTNNTVTGCLTGQSETTTFNGNVQNFVVAGNTIYNNDNIGMDAIGFEKVGPTGADQATNGDVYGNTIYNNSGANNPGYASSGQRPGWGQDGLYCDACTQVVFERNLVYGNDLGIEAASETTGYNSTDVIIRNNLVYGSNYAGVSVGGYCATGCGGKGAENGGGGSQNITIANNTLFENSLGYENPNSSSQIQTGAAEFQVQYRATGIVFDNNIVYAGPHGNLLLELSSTAGVTLNYNDYYTTSSSPTFQLPKTTYTSFSSYQATGQDKNSVFANPDFLTLPVCSPTGYTPTGGYTPAVQAASCSSLGNTDLAASSPSSNAGTNTLGTPSGNGYSSYEKSAPFAGSVDYNGNNRVNSSGQINIGAYEQ